MSPSDYQLEAFTYAVPQVGYKQEILHGAVGLAEEVGELLGLIKKDVFYNKGENAEKIKEELGDVLWYVTYLMTLHELNVEDVMEANLDKLEKRREAGYYESHQV